MILLVAIQSGEFAARQIAARLQGKPQQAAYRYRDLGTLATISRFRAIAVVGPLRLSGAFAWPAGSIVPIGLSRQP